MQQGIEISKITLISYVTSDHFLNLFGIMLLHICYGVEISGGSRIYFWGGTRARQCIKPVPIPSSSLQNWNCLGGARAPVPSPWIRPYI